MFEKAIPGFEPSERARTLARAALNILDRVIADCISAGYLVPTQPRKIADALWAAAQGAISLERAGYFRDGSTYERSPPRRCGTFWSSATGDARPAPPGGQAAPTLSATHSSARVAGSSRSRPSSSVALRMR